MKINTKITGIILTLLFGFGLNLSAQDWNPVKKVSEETNLNLISKYRNIAYVPMQNFVTPKALRVDFRLRDIKGYSFGVYNETAGSFVPYVFSKYLPDTEKAVSAKDVLTYENMLYLFDGSSATTKTLYLNSGDSGSVTIGVEFPSDIKSNSINLELGSYVALPNSVTIKAVINNSEVVVLNKYSPKSYIINFPETVAKKWLITIDYSQMTLISEIQFNNLLDTASTGFLMFLSLPNNTYKIYLNPDVSVQNYADNIEKSNLYNVTDTGYTGILNVLDNPAFVPADTDNDGVPDFKDNCYSIYNPDQKDLDRNLVGDDCDDNDQDKIINSMDNCINVANYNQKDTDGDKIGDACDPDESRITEKHPWLVWSGIGFATVVFIGLLFIASKKMRTVKEDEQNPVV